MNELKYEMIAVGRLIPYINNARTHSADQASSFQNIMVRWGLHDKMLEFVAEISEKVGRINSHTAFK